MNTPIYGDFDTRAPGQEVIVTVGCLRLSPFAVWTDIYVMHADGSFMDGWGPKRVDTGGADASPALADLDGNGTPELILVINQDRPVISGYVTVLAPDGSVAAGHWPVRVDEAVTHSPVVADLDGDGLKEVLAATRDGKLWVWRHDGTGFAPGFWPVDLGGKSFYAPAVGILQRGSGPKIVIGCRPPGGQGTLYVFGPDGTLANGDWPQHVTDRYIFLPSIADIDQDGDGEIVIGAGSGVLEAGHVHTFRADGSVVAGSWPAEIYDSTDPDSSPGGEPHFVSIADLDPTYPGLEVVTAPMFRNKIYAYHADGTAVPGWPAGGRAGSYIGNSVLLGDLDGQSGLEVVVGEGLGDQRGRYLYMLHADGTDLPGTPIDLGGFMQASPAMGDIDSDGKIEVIQPVASKGTIRLLEVESPRVLPGSAIWPMQQHDACQTGFLNDFPKVHAVEDPADWVGFASRLGSAGDLRIWPNASGDGITLHLQLREPGTVSLKVFNLQGRQVATLADERDVRPGETNLRIPGIEACGSGVYFARTFLRSAGL